MGAGRGLRRGLKRRRGPGRGPVRSRRGRGEDATRGGVEKPSSGRDSWGIGRWVHENLLAISRAEVINDFETPTWRI
jgi:hypothetical protein